MLQCPVCFTAGLPISHWVSTCMNKLARVAQGAFIRLKSHAKLLLLTFDVGLGDPCNLALRLPFAALGTAFLIW